MYSKIQSTLLPSLGVFRLVKFLVMHFLGKTSVLASGQKVEQVLLMECQYQVNS